MPDAAAWERKLGPELATPFIETSDGTIFPRGSKGVLDMRPDRAPARERILGRQAQLAVIVERHYFRTATDKRVVEMASRGMTQGAIGKATGVSQGWINAIIVRIEREWEADQARPPAEKLRALAEKSEREVMVLFFSLLRLAIDDPEAVEAALGRFSQAQDTADVIDEARRG